MKKYEEAHVRIGIVNYIANLVKIGTAVILKDRLMLYHAYNQCWFCSLE
jgi:hypothetical protein